MTQTSAATVESYKEFYDVVTTAQFETPIEPYRFGSYEVYQANADDNNFQVNVFVNATSLMSVPYF